MPGKPKKSKKDDKTKTKTKNDMSVIIDVPNIPYDFSLPDASDKLFTQVFHNMREYGMPENVEIHPAKGPSKEIKIIWNDLNVKKRVLKEGYPIFGKMVKCRDASHGAMLPFEAKVRFTPMDQDLDADRRKPIPENLTIACPISAIATDTSKPDAITRISKEILAGCDKKYSNPIQMQACTTEHPDEIMITWPDQAVKQRVLRDGLMMFGVNVPFRDMEEDEDEDVVKIYGPQGGATNKTKAISGSDEASKSDTAVAGLVFDGTEDKSAEDSDSDSDPEDTSHLLVSCRASEIRHNLRGPDGWQRLYKEVTKNFHEKDFTALQIYPYRSSAPEKVILECRNEEIRDVVLLDGIEMFGVLVPFVAEHLDDYLEEKLEKNRELDMKVMTMLLDMEYKRWKSMIHAEAIKRLEKQQEKQEERREEAKIKANKIKTYTEDDDAEGITSFGDEIGKLPVSCLVSDVPCNVRANRHVCLYKEIIKTYNREDFTALQIYPTVGPYKIILGCADADVKQRVLAEGIKLFGVKVAFVEDEYNQDYIQDIKEAKEATDAKKRSSELQKQLDSLNKRLEKVKKSTASQTAALEKENQLSALNSKIKALELERLKSRPTSEVCWNCAKKASQTCTVCRLARYCARECQKTDWKNIHKRTCVELKECDELPKKLCSSVIRAWTPAHSIFKGKVKAGWEVLGDFKEWEISSENVDKNSEEYKLNYFVQKYLLSNIAASVIFGREANYEGIRLIDEDDYVSIKVLKHFDGGKLYRNASDVQADKKPVIFIHCSFDTAESISPHVASNVLGVNFQDQYEQAAEVLEKDGEPHYPNFRDTAMSLLLKILRGNARRIGPALREKLTAGLDPALRDHPRSYVSYVSPLTQLVETNLVKSCAVCGAARAGWCRKCMSVRYCGVTCQQYDWEDGHKYVCFSALINDDGSV